MEKKDTLSSCSDSEIQQMQLIQDKSKESCMYYRPVSDVHQVTVFLDDEYVDMTCLQISYNTLDSDSRIPYLESNGTDKRAGYKEQIRESMHMVMMQISDPLNIEELMAEVGQTAEQCHDIRPLPAKINENKDNMNVSQIQYSRKTFASSTTKVESEPPNGSNADIPNQCESEQALNVSAAVQASVVNVKWRLLKITLQAPFLNVQMTFEQRSSSLVLHQMTSDHNRSELGIQDHSNEQSSSKLVPKVVP
ncbi:hypothetical protein Tco_0778876 [Tanacetum coccineum]